MHKYGQHFLVNKGIIDKITSAVIDNMQGSLVEIGPGKWGNNKCTFTARRK